MTSRRQALAGCGVLLLALTIATGCAERQSKSQYVDAVAPIHDDRRELLDELPTHEGSDVDFFSEAQERTRQALDDLESIQPPREAQAAHDKHVEGMRGLLKILGRLADCARLQRRDAEAGRQCRDQIDQLELDEVRNDLQEADAVYEELGYEFGAAS